MRSDDTTWRRIERVVLEQRFGIGLPWEVDAIVLVLSHTGAPGAEQSDWQRLRGKCMKIVGPGVIRSRFVPTAGLRGLRFVAFRAADSDFVSELERRVHEYGFEVIPR